MSDNNGQQNQHDNAFGNGRNPGIGGVVGGGSVGGGNGGGSGSTGATGTFTGWCMSNNPEPPISYGPDGQVRITIVNGWNRCNINVRLGDKGNAAGINERGLLKEAYSWKPKPEDWNVIENGQSGTHQSGSAMTSYLVRVGTQVYDVIVMDGKIHYTSYANMPPSEGGRFNYSKSYARDKPEAHRIVMDYLDVKDAVYKVSTFYKEVGNKFGAALSKEAEALAEAAKGKKIRNADQAIAAFNRYKDVLNKKFSVADREAIARALESMDKNQMAKQLSTFGKAFGLVGTAIDVNDMRVAVTKGIRTGDWNDAFRTSSRLATTQLASAAVAFAFAALTSTPMGIIGYALIMAFTSALIDDALMDRINQFMQRL